MRIVPEVVVFDLGKVLIDFDFSIAAQKIAARSTLPADAVQEFLNFSPVFTRFEMGLLTSEEFFQEVCAQTGFCGGLAEFAGFFCDIFTPIEPMVQAQAQLRARRIPTYVFSNTNDLSVSFIRRMFPFFANFDGYVLSFQHQAMKPDARLYQVLEKLSGRCGPQILYLDDRLENTETGKARGWQVIHHENPEKSIDLLWRSGIME